MRNFGGTIKMTTSDVENTPDETVEKNVKSISQASEAYLKNIVRSRSKRTGQIYRTGMAVFLRMLSDQGIDIDKTSINQLTENAVSQFIEYLETADLEAAREKKKEEKVNDKKSQKANSEGYAVATEKLYLVALSRFYKYLTAQGIKDMNLPRVELIIQSNSRKAGRRLPQFPVDKIKQVLLYAETLNAIPTTDQVELLCNLRDRALILTLADTGLRIHEACKLQRGNVDLNEGQALLIGKGNQEALIRFSARAIAAIRDYLRERAKLDGASQKQLYLLPVFSRHDRAAGTKIKPISTTTGRAIISRRVTEAIGEETEWQITPHTFRHYFVTSILRAKGNLKMAQDLARHKSINSTQIYAHLSNDELDQGYHDIFG
jgi:integrase/recombinase XerC